MRTRTMTSLLTAGLLLVGACGDDAGSTGTDAGGETDTETTEPKDGQGTISLRLEQIDGVMIEGFALGLRFTGSDGEVIEAIQWNDYVESLGTGDLEAFYDSVLEQPVPAGTVTIEANLVQSIGGPIEPPDLEGDFPCSLDVEVPEGGTVEVEVAFSTEPDCITQL